MTTLTNALIIGSGVIREAFGQPITVTSSPGYLAVWPGNNSGKKAEGVLLQPGGNFHWAVDAAPQTQGQYSAYLKSGSEYFFPLHPTVQTLGFLSATGTSNQMRVTWIVMR